MNKQDLILKLKKLDGLTSDEKAALINLVNTKKKYGLVWEEKPEEVEEDLRKNLPVLKEVKENAIINGDNYPNHILIEGDNLHSLTALTFTHENKIDVIYFDPPYNTGAKDWKYNNDFVDENDGWRHSKWINFMYRRLNIAKRLLTDDGALICAIDHNEQENLGILLRETFPSKEITCVTIVHNPRGIQGDNFSYTHEYAYFVYPKGRFIGRISRDEQEYEWSNLRNWGGESERKDGKSLFYPIYFKDEKLVSVGETPDESFHPSGPYEILADGTLEIWPIDNNGIERKWRYSIASLKEIPHKIKLVKKDGVFQVQLLKDEDRPKTVWVDKKYDANIYGTQILGSIIKTKFPFPKSLYTVEDCIMAVLNGKKDAIILDYFAGSGTTGHAVLNINKMDDGNRKFILCTNNESGICEQVTYQRIKNCIQGYEYQGTEKDVLYKKKLNVSMIKQSEKLFAEIDKISENNKAVYSSLKMEIQDDSFQLTGIKQIESFKDGFNKNNLRYYKTEFVSREPTLKNKQNLTLLATELLCIKEDCYVVHSINTDWLSVFHDDKGQYLFVIYDDNRIEESVIEIREFIKSIQPDKLVKVYVFSNGQYPYTEEFEDILNHITLCALPDAIYKAYQNVLPTIQKITIPEIEESTAQEVEETMEEINNLISKTK
jgi:adenine-specific DNA-methyltransferase